VSHESPQQISKTLQRVAFGTPAATVTKLVHREGAVILENVLDSSQVARITADLDAPLEALHFGSSTTDAGYQAFHGYRTKRMTNVVTLSPTAREDFISNPILLGYVTELFKDVCDTYWLQTCQAIEIHPGEKAQLLHRDMDTYPVFRRYGPDGAPEVTINCILALVDCTEEAGATRVIPGSNTWTFRERGTPAMTVAAELPAGSALLMSGKTIHGGGANVTTNVKRRVLSTAFNPGFLTPEEAYPFFVPLEVARGMSSVMQQLIGFRSFHQHRQHGGSLWQHNYEEIADYLKL
jgi:ectoine hydroxylase-related dioxygenase (phytanoyl-CoA dioxygenase family)